MQDRIPLYPGRVKMTPVAGQANTFDMVRADDPTQAGTPLNKATLLKDATAALYGLGTGAVPDDVLAELGKYKQYWWRRRLTPGEHYIEVKTNISSSVDMVRQNSILTCQLSKYITINQTSGVISLDSPETVNAPTSISEVRSTIAYLSTKAPFYFQRNGSTVVYYVPQDATFTDNLFSSTYTVSGSIDDNDRYAIMLHAPSSGVKGQKVATTKQTLPAGDWQYVQSSNRNAYPDSGTQDSYEYEYLGIPFDNAVTAPKIETGSYVGTGTYGESNPNTLTFGFVPKFVIFIDNGYYNSSKTLYEALFQRARNLINCELLPDSYGDSAYFLGPLGYAGHKYTGWEEAAWKTNGGKTINWLSTNSAKYQFNEIDRTYYYIAIG